MLMNVGRLVYCVFEDRQHTYMLTIIGIVVNAKFSGCLLMVSLGTTSYVVLYLSTDTTDWTQFWSLSRLYVYLWK